jgi:hypothetical protein
MKNKTSEILLILLFTQLLLTGLAIGISYAPGSPLMPEWLRFMNHRELFTLRSKDPNQLADSLLQIYLSDTGNDTLILSRKNLSAVGPRKQNLYLFNPETEGERPLDNFFKALLHCKDSTVVRIAHYGDSQLEGDRMSSVIRDVFHKQFGGSGPGYVPMKDLAPVSYSRTSSGNWSRYSVFHDKYANSFYGLSGTVCRFSGFMSYTAPTDSSDGGKTPSENTDSGTSQPGVYSRSASVNVKLKGKYHYDQIRVLYGRCAQSCIMNCYDTENGQRISSDTLPPAEKAALAVASATSFPLSLRIEFVAGSSPDFYGIYLDGRKGVQVDNFAIRGHSGDGLMLIDDEHLAGMLRLLNTRLIIFQYGANVVPYIRSDKACEWLGGIYYQLFMKFRKAAPQASILVIGAGDMARGGEGGYASYPYLPKISEAQKKAALDAGCAYWDLFNMMGGSNSILVWSAKNLAVNNGHFSNKGQEIISNQLVEALMVEYNMFIHRNRNKK